MSLMAIPPVARYLVAAFALFTLANWLIDRFLGERDDPSFSVGGDWMIIRFSGTALVLVVALVGVVSVAPEIVSTSGAKWLAIAFAGLVAIWWALKSRESNDQI